MGNAPMRHTGGGYDPDCTCSKCMARTREIISKGGTFGGTAFRDAPQRDDPSVTNTYSTRVCGMVVTTDTSSTGRILTAAPTTCTLGMLKETNTTSSATILS